MHPDWPRLSRIAEEVTGRVFESCEMGRAFGEMLRAVGMEMQGKGFLIFRLTLERLDLEAHEAAYVGDSHAHDALAARATGLRGILLDPLELHPESVCPRIRSLVELIKRVD